MLILRVLWDVHFQCAARSSAEQTKDARADLIAHSSTVHVQPKDWATSCPHCFALGRVYDEALTELSVSKSVQTAASAAFRNKGEHLEIIQERSQVNKLVLLYIRRSEPGPGCALLRFCDRCGTDG
jgi:hypothetical protein